MIKNNYSEQSEIKEDKDIFYSEKTIKFLNHYKVKDIE